MKEAYVNPVLVVHGSIRTITLNGVLDNADVDGGSSGTGNCPGGSTDPKCISS